LTPNAALAESPASGASSRDAPVRVRRNARAPSSALAPPTTSSWSLMPNAIVLSVPGRPSKSLTPPRPNSRPRRAPVSRPPPTAVSPAFTPRTTTVDASSIVATSTTV
jgi:hypothetical protein